MEIALYWWWYADVSGAAPSVDSTPRLSLRLGVGL